MRHGDGVPQWSPAISRKQYPNLSAALHNDTARVEREEWIGAPRLGVTLSEFASLKQPVCFSARARRGPRADLLRLPRVPSEGAVAVQLG